jgi:uncharacterized spore protein YtfJ
MSENTPFTQNMDTIFTDLHNFVKNDSVLGAPVVVGDKTLVPVISVTLGYGNPGMAKSNTPNSMSGMGARISTNAVVVIDKSSTTMLTVGEKGNMSQMIDKIPQAISSLGQSMQGQQSQNGQGQQGGQQNQQQGQGSTTK